jgi:hypothetical protein
MIVSNKKPLDMDKLFDGALKWDERYLEAVIHAVELYESYDQARPTIQEFLSRKNKWAFKATNPHSKQIWFHGLINSYLNSNLKDMRPKKERKYLFRGNPIRCALVTFTHRDWVCTDADIQFDLEKAKQKVRNALPRLTFIACFEAAYYTNEEWKKDGKTGKLVSFHCHAIVWANSTYKFRQIRMKTKRRFKPVLGNKSGIRIDTLKSADDVCRVIGYQTKMPFLGYRTIVKDGKRTQKSAKLTNHQRYLLFKAMQTYDVLDLWIAGGNGAGLIANAKGTLNWQRQQHWYRHRDNSRRRPRTDFRLYGPSSARRGF